MMKKGLVTLVCLVVMSAMCAWASTTVYLQTKTTNLGGSITVKKGAVVKSTTSGTGAIKYTAFLTTDSGSYSVAADSGYKIAALKVNGVDVPAAVGQTTYPDATDPGFTGAGVKSVVATFSAATSGSLKSWQLQVKNSAGGDIETTRNSATVSTDYPMGKLVLKNFSDTAPVAVKVTPKTGYHIDSIVFNGKKLAGVNASGYTVPVDPSASGKVFSVFVTYKRDAFVITTGLGILPLNPSVNSGTAITFTVTPATPATAKVGNNTVTGITFTGTGTVTALDVINNVAVDPSKAFKVAGPVKVTISNVTKEGALTATYGSDHSQDVVQNCANSCHIGAAANTYNPAVQQAGPKFLASAHWNNTINDSTTTRCSQSCHFRSNVEGGTAPGSNSACLACHDAVNPMTTKVEFDKTCTVCHSGDHHGGPTNEFLGSKHWNNTFEYGPEFTGGAVPAQINPNESWTTKEDGAATTCAFKCHFKPGMGPDPMAKSTGGITYTDKLNGVTYTRPGGDGCVACHDQHDLSASYQSTCLACHSGSKHGKVPAEFFASKHWNSSLETGPEFTNQMNITVQGGDVRNEGSTTDGVLNANNSYTTKEDGNTVTCAYRCHFRPGMGPQKNVAGYLTNGKAITYVAYSSRATGAKVVYSRPGGDSCMACHSPHGLEASARSTCYTCHTGGNHGWSVKAFEKSLHYTSPYAVAEGLGGPNGKACTFCHNAHSLEATFAVMSSATQVNADQGCQVCHTPGASYSIYAADRTLKVNADPKLAPHASGKLTSTKGGDGVTQYLAQGAICADCHSHNNTINKGFAEGGHGAVSTDPNNAWGHYDWKDRQNKFAAGVWGSRQASNCDRCHTAYGYMAFANQTTGMTRLRLASGGPNNVLICVGCHDNVDKGTLRTGAKPTGNPTALKDGYFALFTSATGKFEVSFPGYKNSSICIPCHSGRTTDTAVKAAIAAQSQYSSVNTDKYQHSANMAQTFIGKGAYDFTGRLAAIGATGHAAVGMSSTSSQGPCVGCHHTKDGKTHSLEVVPSTAGCVAAACHPTVPDVDAAKANFDAGVAALDKLIREKFAPLLHANQKLEDERANVKFGLFGKPAGYTGDVTTATNAYGAWYNWQLLTNWDKAAFVHNPAYARQILNDTIGFLANDGVIPAPSHGSISFDRTVVANTITTYSADAATATAANGFITSPGCQGCHAAKVTTYTTSTGFHYTEENFACANCHSEPHQTGTAICRCHGDVAGGKTPMVTAIKANGAVCADCHTSGDIHAMKAGSQANITKKCVECHDVFIPKHTGKVADNDGVRAIMPEFKKRSHHIINADGSAPVDAQCAVCHLEGKSTAPGVVVVDTAWHMKDSNIYLRNVDSSDPDKQFAWNGTNHGDMDNFCFACHDDNGAADVATIQGLIPAATAKNPFADSLKNGYDQVARAGVVDVKTAFTTTNASHHAVSGQRYKYRFSTVANAEEWAARTGKPMPSADQIAENHIGEESPNGGEIEAFDKNEPMEGSFTLGSGTGEGDATLFEAGKFVSAYTPLGASESVADNSVLHCGDCHTVGQFKAGSNDPYNKVAIGAHGSTNEYMLRNNTGTDELHNSVTYVCFNCHVGGLRDPNKHPSTAKTDVVGYATAHAVSAFHIQCQADSADNIGAAARLNNSWEPDKIKAYDYKPAPGATANLPSASTSASWIGYASGSDNGSGNITGIACTNCHNSGLRNGFGGIHGGDNTYTDGLGRSQKTYRFMPGMGNYKYAPPGGWDGKDLSNQPATGPTPGASLLTPTGKPAGGCYTNSAPGKGDENPGYSACMHHGTSAAAAGNEMGGGTTKTTGASEPTVREATAGNALVTRPLKY